VDVYRTPDARFEGLSGYPFQPHYATVDGLRMHYLDEGDANAAPVLMLHGEPTWSCLYRHMIGGCTRAGQRVVAPDLIGFGKSDKPTALRDYSYQRHVDWLKELVRALDLRRITLFCQDWGALIGLRVAAEEQARFDRVVVGNGALPALESSARVPLGAAAAFLTWRAFATYSPWFPISAIVDFGCRRPLSAEERRAYDAPFPERAARAGARAFPRLVPISRRDPSLEPNRAAWRVLRAWHKPFLTVFSDGDPITRGQERIFQAQVPGAKHQPHTTPHAGHFLQEDVGPELAETINSFIAATR
jgi:haloalkane dehalogenase